MKTGRYAGEMPPPAAGTRMSLYPIILLGGALISAFLVLHHLAAVKQDGDHLLNAYRRLLAENRRRRGDPLSSTDADD